MEALAHLNPRPSDRGIESLSLASIHSGLLISHGFCWVLKAMVFSVVFVGSIIEGPRKQLYIGRASWVDMP